MSSSDAVTRVPEGARSFARTAEEYERARPSYAPEAVDAVVREFGLASGATVVDLGAGTGKWTRLLTARGFRVIAVEPIAEMRSALERAVPDATAVDGTAEAIPVPDGTAAAVTAAQAFHWFRAERALAEIHRVLSDGGGLAAVWNVPDESDSLQAALGEIVAPYRGAYPGRDVSWNDLVEASGLFDDLAERRFPHVHTLDADGVVARVASISWIGALDPAERERVLQRVRALVADRPGPIEVGYVTEVFTCKAR